MADGLFGMTEQDVLTARQQQAQQNAFKMAQLDPQQLATYGASMAGSQLGSAVRGLFGGTDPELAKVTRFNQIISQIDLSDPKSIRQSAQELGRAGFTREAMAFMDKAGQLEDSQAGVQQKRAAANKTAYELQKEQNLQKALAELPIDATPEQYLEVVRKYGSPDKVMTSIQTSMDRAEQRKQALELKKMDIESRIELAKQQGADRMMIAQMQIEGRKEIAAMAAALKGEKSLTPAQIKAEEKRIAKEEAKQQLTDILDTTSSLVDQIAAEGGMPSTSKSGLANLKASTSASSLGQFAGKVVGSETQAKRDQVESLRLQLLNAIAASTGMTASRLNSNVELQLALKSLGAPGMTKEANQAIINNLRKTYLQGGGIPASANKPQGTGTRDNPIKLD